MSGSPKYSQAQLRAQQEQRLRQERERRAREEAARRLAEEERRRKARLATAKNGLQDAVAVVETRLSRFEGAEAARLVQGELDALRKLLREADRAGRSADAEGAVSRVQRDVKRLEGELRELEARAEAQLFAANLAREEAAVQGLQRRLAALDTELSRKFDGAGLQGVQSALEDARAALERKDLARVSRVAQNATKALEAHGRRVRERFAEWSEERNKALAAIAEADDCVGGLEADEVVMRWCGAEVGAIRALLENATARDTDEDFSAAVTMSNQAVADTRKAVSDAQAAQLKEERRRYIAEGIVQVMQDMGFVVQAGYPVLDDPARPGSDLIIQAARIGGGAVAVSVPQEGDVWYDVDGFPKELAVGAAGQEVRTCDEAERAITEMHAALDEAFGVQMGELMWEGKDPDRIAKQADVLPGGTDTSRRLRGGV